MTFSDKLKSLRAEYSLSQEELAKRIKMSPSAISSWENNVRSPKIEQIMKIAEAFNMNWLDLIDDKEIFAFSSKNEDLSLLESYRSLNDKGRQILSTIIQSLLLNPLYKNR